MVQLKYKGSHQPSTMVVDVDESKVKELLDSGDFESLNNPKKTEPVKEVIEDDSILRRNKSRV